jgi:hypothetical protein
MIDLYREGRVLRTSDEETGLPIRLEVNLFDITDCVEVRADKDTQLPTDPVSMANLVLSLSALRDENGVPYIDRELVASLLKIPGFKEAVARINAASAAKAQAAQQAAMLQKQGGQNQSSIEQAQTGASQPQVMDRSRAMRGNMGVPPQQAGQMAGAPPDIGALLAGINQGR